MKMEMKKIHLPYAILALSAASVASLGAAPALAAASLPVKSVLLIGQSNMAGRGEFDEVPPVDNSDRRLLMLRNGRWQPLSDPICVDRGVFGSWHSGVGPGASFARAFADARPGVRIGLIPCADGGTRLEDWAPGGVLYDNAVFQVRQARRTSEVVAILWHQGEGDSDTSERAAAYREKFTAFLASLRRDAGLEDVPVVVGELGRFLAVTKRWTGLPENFETVNAALRAVAAADPRMAFVSSEGLTCKDDEIHFDSKSQREFGRRYAAALLGLMAQMQAAAEKSRSGGVCNCAVCPVRQNDFVWENDRFGMRAYGPGEYHRWSGLDVFNKNVATNICLAWCQNPVYSRYDARPNFHVNLGQGMDNYTMGAARGVGAVAMFADGEWKTYPDWETSRVLHTGDDYLEFELVYPAFSAAGRMTYHITLRRGEAFFRNDVSFERMPADFLVGPGLDLEPKRDHAGDLKEGPGFVSLYENPKGEGGKDGSTMVAVFTAPGETVTPMTDHLNCRVLAFRGRKSFTYWAGADWSLAGRVANAAAWHKLVEDFRKDAK